MSSALSSLPAGGKQKVSFICQQDWGNVSTAMAAAINAHSAKLQAKSICCEPHPFGYQLPHDFDVETDPACRAEAKAWFDASSFVVYAHERGREYAIADFLKSHAGIDIFTKPRRFIFHAGTIFRTHFKWFNRTDHVFSKQLISPDLFRLARADALPLFGRPQQVHQDIETRICNRFQDETILVTHTPSRPAVKGTERIRAVVERVQDRFEHVRYVELGRPPGCVPVPNADILKLKLAAHIHIDQFNVLGGIGISGIEALAAGNIVLGSRHHISREVYRMWGMRSCPIIDVGTSEKRLHENLCRLVASPQPTLIAASIESAKWVAQHLSYAAYVGFLEQRVFELPQRQ